MLCKCKRQQVDWVYLQVVSWMCLDAVLMILWRAFPSEAEQPANHAKVLNDHERQSVMWMVRNLNGTTPHAFAFNKEMLMICVVFSEVCNEFFCFCGVKDFIAHVE